MSRGGMAGRRSMRIGRDELEPGPLADRIEGEARAAYLRARERIAPLPPPLERSAMSETAWQRLVVELAQRLDYYVYHPKLSRWSERGWPDLSLLGRRALWLEVKSDHGNLTPAQVEVIERMRSCGLEVHVVRPHDGLAAIGEMLQWPNHPARELASIITSVNVP